MRTSQQTQEINETALVKSIAEGFVVYSPVDQQIAAICKEDNQSKRLTAVQRIQQLPRYIAGLPSAVIAQFHQELARGITFLLTPVFLGVGVLLYFTLSFEPDWTPLVSACLILGLCRFLARRNYYRSLVFNGILILMLGISAAKFQTDTRSTPMIGGDVSTTLTGRIVALDQLHSGGWRIILDVLDTERPHLRYAPKRVKLTARDLPAHAEVGAGLRGFVRLRAPSGPVRVGNYDFSFHAYFQGIGANGFWMGTPKSIVVSPVKGIGAVLSEKVATLRASVGGRIMDVLVGENGSVAAALISGQRAGISEETNEALRKSGLAHILSISGLHMALAAAVVMWSLRSLFALFPGFSSRHPVRKYAALLSLLSCTFYLAMSGADVAAQRSYVMIAVILCALMTDRIAISMRNVAIAAIAMIVISPHEMLGPSFQMSFSATAALIAAFAWWSERNSRQHLEYEKRGRPAKSMLGKLLENTLTTGATSLVAGVASGVFAAYHFNNTAPLGLLGNALALPVISVLVMPFAVLALLLMPLQLDWLPLQIMGLGISLVRMIAEAIAEISPEGNPGLIPDTTLVLWTIAIVVAVIFTSRLKVISLVFVIAGAIPFSFAQKPDILISEDGKLVGVNLSENQIAFNRAKPQRFTSENWKTGFLADTLVPPIYAPVPDKMRGFICEDGVCSLELSDGRILAYTDQRPMAEIACNIGDVVIIAVAGKSRFCSDQQQRLIVTKRDLALFGTHQIWLRPEARDRSKTVDGNSQRDHVEYAVGVPNRPWNTHRLYSRAGRGLEDYK